MRILVTLISTFLFINCVGQTKSNKETIKTKVENMIEIDSLKRPDDAFQMNMGFDDAPAWVWVKYDTHLKQNGKTYNHIYGINFWDKDGYLKKLYYELDRNINYKKQIDFNNVIINPYPGDKTLQLISRESDTLFIFNVLEMKEYQRNLKGKSYKRIPTVNNNDKKQKVSSYDIEINLLKKNDKLFEITLIDSHGIKTFDFISNCDIDVENPNYSYYDIESGKIYFLNSECYLEKLKN